MFLNEIYCSLQGECLDQGAPTVFVRFAGCNLCCNWCDTPYAQNHSDCMTMSPSAIVDRIRGLFTRPRRVCLTGGEPLLQPRTELVELVFTLRREFGSSFVIETNGACPVDWILDGKLTHPQSVSLAVDYKLDSSGMSQHMSRRNLLRLRSSDVLKFVCGGPGDKEQALEVLRSLSGVHGCNPTVFFHGEGGLADKTLAQFVLDLDREFAGRFDIRHGVQLHKLLWGSERAR